MKPSKDKTQKFYYSKKRKVKRYTLWASQYDALLRSGRIRYKMFFSDGKMKNIGYMKKLP